MKKFQHSSVTNNVTVNNGNVSIVTNCYPCKCDCHECDCEENPFNPKNCLDSCGQIHNILTNECVKYTEAEFEKEGLKEFDLVWTIDKSSYILRQNNFKIDSDKSYKISDAVIKDLDNYSYNVVASLKLSDNYKKQYLELIENIKKLAEAEKTDYAEYKELVLDFENVLLEDYNSKNKELTALLSST